MVKCTISDHSRFWYKAVDLGEFGEKDLGINLFSELLLSISYVIVLGLGNGSCSYGQHKWS
jgi:hypothetical protein